VSSCDICVSFILLILEERVEKRKEKRKELREMGHR
jgi:hypothetical protein